MHPIDKAARIAGVLYLLLIAIGPFSLIYVPNTIIVSDNAAATAAHILAHETVFRLGILGDLVSGTVFLFLVFALYRLFKSVDQDLAAMLVVLGGLMQTPIYFLNSLNWIAALTLVNGSDYLGVFSKAQLDALAMLFIHLHSQGNVVSLIFAGLWLFPFGILVIRSGFLPRFLGIWLIAEGFAWPILSLTGLFAPQYQDTVFTYSQPLFFAEIAIMLWMLIMGAKIRPPAIAAT
ncbi:MAG TPA: DUF4386 domain-containing protein [Candidatus Eremiobacteraceae bacterium]